MRLLHTSDWHIGRTFHTHSTPQSFSRVMGALVDAVTARRIDVVLVSGDVFDSAVPSADAYTVLGDTLRAIRTAGANVVLTSGNHDSATRLGFQAEWAGAAGIHVLTRHEHLEVPVTIADDHGPVHFYGLPFLEPSLIRHHYPEVQLRTQREALEFAMDRVRADLVARGGRAVVLAHCFAAAGAPSVDAAGPERDITAGGLDLIATATFDGPDYVALGHIHGRAVLTPRVRYSGAPLHYSFSEAGRPRGGWVVELDSDGIRSVDWLDLPVPRELSELTGTLDELLTSTAFASAEQHWVKANLTDVVRPLDGMRRLQARFPNCVALEYRPSTVAETEVLTYGQRIDNRSDLDIIGGFVEFVRNGEGATASERRLVAELFHDPVGTR